MTPFPKIVVCPGVHHPTLTDCFIKQLVGQIEQNKRVRCQSEDILIFPTRDYPAYSAFHIWQFLQDNLGRETAPLVFISFSAGVAGAIAAATGWQMRGGRVKAFIALDGWGVPLYGNFPVYRLSHDYFTHWSSALLGAGEESFWAAPAVEHLELWRSPATVGGYAIRSSAEGWQPPTPTNAALFLATLIERHGVIIPPLEQE